MDIEKFMEFINYIENKYDVDKWSIGDTHIWPLIRIKLGLYVSYYNQSKLSKEENNVEVNKEKIKFDEINPTIIDKWVNNSYDAVFLSHTGARTNINGVWYDRFCDQVIKQLINENKESLILEYTTFDRYRDKNSIDSYRITEEAAYYLQQHYNDQEYSGFDYSLNGYDMFLKETFEFLNSIKYEMPGITIEWLINEYKQIRIIADYFKLILAKTAPKIGFAVCYYTNFGFAFNLACKEMNVVSVDLQHGYNSKYHFSYALWSNVPDGGYELLPQVFWCWSKEEEILIKQWSLKSNFHKALTGGNTWLTLWENIKSKINSDSNSILDKLNDKNYIKILYTQSDNIDDFIFDAIDKSPDNWMWLIRFHPLIPKENRKMFINKLNKLHHKNLEWEIDDIPLFALIENIDVNVTTASSTVIDSQYFGKKSIVTTKAGEQTYKNLIISGLVKAAYNTDELLKCIIMQAGFYDIQKEYINNNQIKKAVEKLEILHKYIYPKQEPIIDKINNLIKHNYNNCIEKCIEFNNYDEILAYYSLVNCETQFKETINKMLELNILNRNILRKFIFSEKATKLLCCLKDSKVKNVFIILLYYKTISLEDCIDITSKLTNIKSRFQSIRLVKCILFECIKYIADNFSEYEEQYYNIFQHYIKVSFDYIKHVYNITEILNNAEEIADNEIKFIIYMYLYDNNRINSNDLISGVEKTIPYMRKFLINI